MCVSSKFLSSKLSTKKVCTNPVSRTRVHTLRVYSYLTAKQPELVPTKTFSNQLEALKSMSTVVADTGDIELIQQYQPVDCTTNPSLVLKAVQKPEYAHFIKEAIEEERESGSSEGTSERPYSGVVDRLIVNMGCEVLKIVPGRVSTEVDAHLSYDTEATIAKAKRIIGLYADKGIDTSRVYIKIASTWEGIQACAQLQQEGIDCNLTLLFSFAQACACANAKASLISPFVGRIMDWYKAKGHTFTPEEDPGVLSVRRIYQYYKKYGIPTIVMAASFRNISEIQQLAGCDNITISPQLLGELEQNSNVLPQKLWPEMGGSEDDDYSAMDEPLFRTMHGQDTMAVEKLEQGIDGFATDQRKLEDLIAEVAKTL
eukprot:TRINITY_DN4875_c0_g1_i7.p1 TRINITY_DN4875_c0_g1~~TRINITY_DN4875_c0_g1_i7.p1  ORF type:complete len:407 (-),score=51.28 TRINITY_DN4875_c0_g1_i7:735-1850(-)